MSTSIIDSDSTRIWTSFFQPMVNDYLESKDLDPIVKKFLSAVCECVFPRAACFQHKRPETLIKEVFQNIWEAGVTRKARTIELKTEAQLFSLYHDIHTLVRSKLTPENVMNFDIKDLRRGHLYPALQEAAGDNAADKKAVNAWFRWARGPRVEGVPLSFGVLLRNEFESVTVIRQSTMNLQRIIQVHIDAHFPRVEGNDRLILRTLCHNFISPFLSELNAAASASHAGTPQQPAPLASPVAGSDGVRDAEVKAPVLPLPLAPDNAAAVAHPSFGAHSEGMDMLHAVGPSCFRIPRQTLKTCLVCITRTPFRCPRRRSLLAPARLGQG